MKPGDTVRVPRAPHSTDTWQGTVLHIVGDHVYVGFVIEHEDGDTYPMGLYRLNEIEKCEP